MIKKDDGKKGTFGDLQLSVAKEYVFPNRRKTMMFLGAASCFILLAYWGADFFYLKGGLTSSGPLSSYHANFENNCTACHEPFASVTNAKCSACHEKSSDKLGVYTFAAHAVYRSGDWRRIKSSAKAIPCYLCHQEHSGREAGITNLLDSRCTSCHVYGSFNEKHPQFEFAVKRLPDDSTLLFTHIRHVKEVMKQEKLQDVERACLYCHNPQPNGKHFAPIEFDQHCSACHLTRRMATPPLKIKSLDDPTAAGVETLEMIRSRQGPGTTWALFANPNEFALKPGNRMIKSPVAHEDLWIIENLKTIRRQLYPHGQSPNLDFTDLLKTSGKVAAQNWPSFSATIYNEALATLQEYASGLRGSAEPEVQKELVKIDLLLKKAQDRLQRQPYAGVNPRFLLPAVALNPRLTSDQIEALNILVDDLTQPCQQCHLVAQASILRVRKDQQVLWRAEFNHRAHTLQQRCLECHTEIAITPKPGMGAAVQKAKDKSAIQNLPKIEKCRTCHNPTQSSNRCVTCHEFHPTK